MFCFALPSKEQTRLARPIDEYVLASYTTAVLEAEGAASHPSSHEVSASDDAGGVDTPAAAELPDCDKQRPLWSPGIQAQKNDPIPLNNPFYPEPLWSKAAFSDDYTDSGMIDFVASLGGSRDEIYPYPRPVEYNERFNGEQFWNIFSSEPPQWGPLFHEAEASQCLRAAVHPIRTEISQRERNEEFYGIQCLASIVTIPYVAAGEVNASEAQHEPNHPSIY